MAQKGYSVVNGQLVQVDQNPFNYGGGSKAQVYMTDAEFAERGSSISITPTAGYGGGSAAPTGGGFTPSIDTTKAKGTQVSNIFSQMKPTMNGSSGFYQLPGGQKVATNRWGDPVMTANGYVVDNKDVTAQQLNEMYMSGKGVTSAPASPTILDQPVQPATPQQTAPVIQPTTPIKTNPAVQAAAEAEKAAIQDTFSRTDTILSGPQDLYGGQAENDNVFRVRAGYRRKSRLGA